ncbi:MAG: helix-turn-helix transcriptional regulator [Chloroflexi bacterium]|nr:helix-turn-helix transcriptional regulator [Chloroflexota bacterium]
MAGRQRRQYRTEPSQFPTGFADKLAEFRAAAGLSWRELARLLRVNVRTVHRWRNGAKPDAGHLLSLLELAADRHLLHILAPNLVGCRLATIQQSRGDEPLDRAAPLERTESVSACTRIA